MKELHFQLFSALFGAEDLVLDLFQFRSDEAFRVHHGLFPMVMGRGLFRIRFADLDEVSEDAVVANFQRLDASRLHLARLELGDPFFALTGSIAQVIEFLMVAVTDESTFLDGGGRLVDDSAVDGGGQLAEIRYLGEQGGGQS